MAKKQGTLFTKQAIKEEHPLIDGKLTLVHNFFSVNEALNFSAQLRENIQWETASIKLFGKEIPIPRLQAWYGDPGSQYSYSGIQLTPRSWTSELLLIKERIERSFPFEFNSVLLNYYRDGNDSMSWHSDDEKELGKNPVIASVSFGAERVFSLRHRTKKDQKKRLLLTDGSLLLMTDNTQHHWQHSIAKSKRALEGRINLTFRKIL